MAIIDTNPAVWETGQTSRERRTPKQMGDLCRKYRYCTWEQLGRLTEEELDIINQERMKRSNGREIRERL